MFGNCEFGVREFGYDADILAPTPAYEMFPDAPLSGILGLDLYGQPLWNIFEPSSPGTGGPLPGIMGLDIFGQPLWIVNQTLQPGHRIKSLQCSAIIIDNSALLYHRTLVITGNTVIKRRYDYLT